MRPEIVVSGTEHDLPIDGESHFLFKGRAHFSAVPKSAKQRGDLGGGKVGGECVSVGPGDPASDDSGRLFPGKRAERIEITAARAGHKICGRSRFDVWIEGVVPGHICVRGGIRREKRNVPSLNRHFDKLASGHLVVGLPSSVSIALRHSFKVGLRKTIWSQVFCPDIRPPQSRSGGHQQQHK
ncbi:MAG: hypothetical protein BWY79_01237 [Actinobacteria bacterium ADurb.Bin444]|nr:MAG: hypothetical protein BWY79_01237 [Actinobacteria bacterium ADurb.Bin444]